MIHFRPIKPKKMRIPGIKTRVRKALGQVGKEQRQLMYKTTATWQGAKPRFTTKYTITSASIKAVTSPDYRTKGGKKWRWLNEGTRIRWALMSRNFKRKTRPRYLTSYQGRGGPVLIGRRAFQKRGLAPRPGIEAREWTIIISERTGKAFLRLMRMQFKQHGENIYGSG